MYWRILREETDTNFIKYHIIRMQTDELLNFIQKANINKALKAVILKRYGDAKKSVKNMYELDAIVAKQILPMLQ